MGSLDTLECLSSTFVSSLRYNACNQHWARWAWLLLQPSNLTIHRQKQRYKHKDTKTYKDTKTHWHKDLLALSSSDCLHPSTDSPGQSFRCSDISLLEISPRGSLTFSPAFLPHKQKLLIHEFYYQLVCSELIVRQRMFDIWNRRDDSEIKSTLFCKAVMRPNGEEAKSPNWQIWPPTPASQPHHNLTLPCTPTHGQIDLWWQFYIQPLQKAFAHTCFENVNCVFNCKNKCHFWQLHLSRHAHQSFLPSQIFLLVQGCLALVGAPSPSKTEFASF